MSHSLTKPIFQFTVPLPAGCDLVAQSIMFQNVKGQA